ncbi:hypothetical protein [Salegentibacter chungangensis]|uniref:Uncharacterized protein n=1 Tax=Salegentibacter chungangensis TaxID=1335724 RepID=A0ABW3NSN0_9FLAO
MSHRNLVLISKIIFFYSIFYVIMKLIAVFKGAWPEPNLILMLPYLLFALIGGYMMKTDKYHWAYVIAGVIVISLVRYFEKDWMVALHQYFN